MPSDSDADESLNTMMSSIRTIMKSWDEFYDPTSTDDMDEAVRRLRNITLNAFAYPLYMLELNAALIAKECGYRNALSVGCGISQSLRLLSYSGLSTYALDISRAAINLSSTLWMEEALTQSFIIDSVGELNDSAERDIFKQSTVTKKLHYIQADWDNIPMFSSSIDLLLCINCLPYCRNIADTLISITSVVRPGGLIILATHNALALCEPIKSALGGLKEIELVGFFPNWTNHSDPDTGQPEWKALAQRLNPKKINLSWMWSTG